LLKFLAAILCAHLGIARAQYALARMYYEGECVRRNPTKAAHWSGKAASKGNTRAQIFLGNLKIAGFGTPKDLAGAFALAQQAAQHKDPAALHSLAWFYEQGVGTEVDKGRAFSLWKEAAESGDPDAQHAVAWCLFEGCGTSRDVRAARDWCELAIRNGFAHHRARQLLQRAHAELGTSSFDTARPSPAVPEKSRLRVWFDVLSTALRYRLFGMDEATYHLHQSRTYEQAQDYARAAEHARRFLETTEHSESRARLALSYSMLRMDADAVREYRKAVAQWDHPGIVLGLAQAELRVGNVETATELLKRVQHSQLAHDLRHAIQQVQTEIESSSASSHR
jgi:tetratricopeptide (TPR) repeat protein